MVHCVNCEKPVTGKCVQALGKEFHPECFTCVSCKKQITSANFFQEKGFPICLDCRPAPSCPKCQKPVYLKGVKAMDGMWHVECFTCSRCQSQIRSRNFIIDRGMPLCCECREKIKLRQSEDRKSAYLRKSTMRKQADTEDSSEKAPKTTDVADEPSSSSSISSEQSQNHPKGTPDSRLQTLLETDEDHSQPPQMSADPSKPVKRPSDYRTGSSLSLSVRKTGIVRKSSLGPLLSNDGGSESRKGSSRMASTSANLSIPTSPISISPSSKTQQQTLTSSPTSNSLSETPDGFMSPMSTSLNRTESAFLLQGVIVTDWCTACSMPVNPDRAIAVDDLPYHRDCFNCSVCRDPFEEETQEVTRVGLRLLCTKCSAIPDPAIPLQAKLPPGPLIFPEGLQIRVTVHLALGGSVTIEFQPTDLVATAKETAWKQMVDLHGQPGRKTPDDYILKAFDADEYFEDDNLPLFKVPYFLLCYKYQTPPAIALVDVNQHKLFIKEIGAILGRPLRWATREGEAAYFRLKTASIISEARWVRKMPKTSSRKCPFYMDKEFRVRVHINEGEIKRTIICQATLTALEAIEQIFSRHNPAFVEGSIPSDYYFKVIGSHEYVGGNDLIISLKSVQKAVRMKTEVELSLIHFSLIPGLFAEDVVPCPDPPTAYQFAEVEDITNRYYSCDHGDCVPANQVKTSFRIMVRSLRRIATRFRTLNALLDQRASTPPLIYITIQLFNGEEEICASLQTTPCPFQEDIDINYICDPHLLIADIPPSTRMCFTMKAMIKDQEFAIGWVNCLAYDYQGHLRSGEVCLSMWDDDRSNHVSNTSSENFNSNAAAILCLNFSIDKRQIYFEPQSQRVLAVPTSYPKPNIIDEKDLRRITHSDPLHVLEGNDLFLLHKYRYHLMDNPHALPKFLMAVPWHECGPAEEACFLLENWSRPSPTEALELLNPKFGDIRIKTYATKCLEYMSDDELELYLLQLVQVLKSEPYHFSPLARFLLRRALQNRVQIGLRFFWMLKAEMHMPELWERFDLLIEAYLRGCGTHHRESILRQTEFVDSLREIAYSIRTSPSTEEKKRILQDSLGAVKLNPNFLLPLNPRVAVQGLILPKCKFMDSKTFPLWLVFKNSDPLGENVYIIFKEGDDLRQDQLTLQMLNVIDNLWLEDRLDLQLVTYGCISTGKDMGMIEVVLNAETTARIQKNAGGARAAFSDKNIVNWLMQQNTSDTSYKLALENFLLSCAASCVATYVLGIGDRHNDNIMLTKSGHLFHIDFGHFLGNFMTWNGFKRERAPFVLTPDFAGAMGGKDSAGFRRFQSLCSKAFIKLRHHATLFINLFSMMVAIGIPELTSFQDLDYLRQAFALTYTNEIASKHFESLIHESLRTKTTQLNFAIHILAHPD